MEFINAIGNALGSNTPNLVGSKSGIDVASSTVRDATRANSSNNQPNSSSTQAQSNINSAAPSNKQGNVGKNNPNRIREKKNDRNDKPSTTIFDSTVNPMHSTNNTMRKTRRKTRSSKKLKVPEENDSDSDSDSDSDVNIRTPNSTQVRGDITYKNPTESNTDNSILKNKNKPQIKVPTPIQEPKPSWLSKTISNALTSEHFSETPYPSSPYIKDAVMIYDTIDEAIKKKVKYPYTKSFAQTNKTKKWYDKANDIYNEVKRQYNTKNSQYKKDIKNKWNTIKENRKNANEQRQEKKKELQKSKDQAKTDANKLVDELLEKDFNDIKADHPKIIELHIKIQQVEGGPKAYITKLENEAMNMIGGKRGKRTRRKRQPVQKGGNNDDKEKKKKKLKIVNILKQLNSANYIDYEIESIIQELKRLLGRPSTVDTSIPETIKTTTTIQEDMYSEPLPVCNKYDENVDKYEECKKNRETLKNRLQYFKKLKELNAMHNDNALVIFAENTFKYNIETIKAYYEPYAKSDDTTTNKTEKDEKYLATLEKFKSIDKKDSTLEKKITKYNEIVKYLNDNKKHIVNPQLDEKLMTTNTKQTVTQSSSLKNILDVEHILNMIGKFNMDEYQSTYGNANNMGDPGHTKTSSSSVVKSTDILRKEPENKNVEAK